jgi:hypothetical protein
MLLAMRRASSWRCLPGEARGDKVSAATLGARKVWQTEQHHQWVSGQSPSEKMNE